jgi:hypothetical protein
MSSVSAVHTIKIHLSALISQSCEPLRDFNTTLLFTIYFHPFPEIEPFHVKSVRSLFTHTQPYSRIKKKYLEYEVLIAVIMKSTIFWCTKLFGPLKINITDF